MAFFVCIKKLDPIEKASNNRKLFAKRTLNEYEEGVKKIKIKTWDHIRQRFGRINKGRKRSIQLNRIVDKKNFCASYYSIYLRCGTYAAYGIDTVCTNKKQEVWMMLDCQVMRIILSLKSLMLFKRDIKIKVFNELFKFKNF